MGMNTEMVVEYDPGSVVTLREWNLHSFDPCNRVEPHALHVFVTLSE